MSQITIRAIPENVEQEIRKLAYEKRISLSKASVLLLQKALGIEPDQKRNRDLSCVCGVWDETEYNEFTSNVSQFEEIDQEIWE